MSDPDNSESIAGSYVVGAIALIVALISGIGNCAARQDSNESINRWSDKSFDRDVRLAERCSVLEKMHGIDEHGAPIGGVKHPDAHTEPPK